MVADLGKSDPIRSFIRLFFFFLMYQKYIWMDDHISVVLFFSLSIGGENVRSLIVILLTGSVWMKAH